MSILEPLRLNCWWEYKLAPILATIYATAALLRIPFSSLWPVVALVLPALIVCASYVSVLNDLTDAEDDRVSGKRNRRPGESRINSAMLLAPCIAAGIGFLIVWRKDLLLFSTYVLCWLAFALYSAPPFRLKVRGIWGVLADASGAHLFPTLFAVLLLYRWNRTEPVDKWIIFVALWSFAAGVRGILWHQLGDAANDRKIGLRTFACLHPKAAERLGAITLFLELAGFAAMLWITGSALAWLFLGFYGLFALLRWRILGINIPVVKPNQTARLALSEYYIALYPLAFLLTASWQQPAAVLLLLFHCALFPSHCLCLAQEAVAMLRTVRSGTAPKTAVLPS